MRVRRSTDEIGGRLVTYTPETEAAFEAVEAAIDALIAGFKEHDDNEFITGWTLVVSSTVTNPIDPEEDRITLDVIDPTSHYAYYTRRGQDPTLTRGMVEQLRDKLMGIRS